MRVFPWGDQLTMPAVSSGPFASLAAPFTIAIWVWQQFFAVNAGAWSGIGTWFRLNSERAVLRFNQNSGFSDAEFYVRNNDGTYTHLLGGNNLNGNLRTWVHVCGTYDLTMMRLYLNGSQVNSVGNTKASYSVSSDYAIFGSTADQFAGALQEAAVWNRVLTADEIGALSGGGVSGAKPIEVALQSLVYYVPMLEQDHSSAYIPEPELAGTGTTGTPVYTIPRNDGYGSTPPVDWAPSAFLGIPPT